MTTPEPTHDALDAALARRLRKLATLPVDTSALDQRLRRVIAPPQRNLKRFGAGAMAAAAALLAMGLVLFSILSAEPTRASLTDLTHAYQSAVARLPARVSKYPMSKAAMAQACACLPGLKMCTMATMHSCYMTKIQHCPVSCTLLSPGVRPVVVLTGQGIVGPPGKMVHFGGVEYELVAAHGLNFVEATGHGHWMCLMGRSSPAALLRVASRLHG